MILKTKDLVEKPVKDLQEELEGLRKQLFENNMLFHSRRLENTSSTREIRKSIARILTVIKQKENEETRS